MSASSARSPASSGPGTSPPRFRTCRSPAIMPSRCGGSRRGGRTGRSRRNTGRSLGRRGGGRFRPLRLGARPARDRGLRRFHRFRHGVALFRGQLALRAVLRLSDPDLRELCRGRDRGGVAWRAPRRAASDPVRSADCVRGLCRLAGFSGPLRDAALHVRRLDFRAGARPPDAARSRCAAAGIRGGDRQEAQAGRL